MKLFKSTQVTLLTTALIVIGSIALMFPREAEARHRRVIRRPSIHLGFGGAYYFGSYSPFYRGYPYGYAYRERPGGLNPAIARAIGIGGLDLNIKPRKAEVFVNGEYAGTVADFDGYPSFLWLDEGDHIVTIYKGGFKTFEENFAIKAGVVYPVKFQLAPGTSEPPLTETEQAYVSPTAFDLATSVAAR